MYTSIKAVNMCSCNVERKCHYAMISTSFNAVNVYPCILKNRYNALTSTSINKYVREIVTKRCILLLKQSICVHAMLRENAIMQ